jgi:hypothetical protein
VTCVDLHFRFCKRYCLNCRLQDFDTMKYCKLIQTFQRNVLPPFSQLKEMGTCWCWNEVMDSSWWSGLDYIPFYFWWFWFTIFVVASICSQSHPNHSNIHLDPDPATMQMQVACSSKTSMSTYIPTCCQNLRSCSMDVWNLFTYLVHFTVYL